MEQYKSCSTETDTSEKHFSQIRKDKLFNKKQMIRELYDTFCEDEENEMNLEG